MSHIQQAVFSLIKTALWEQPFAAGKDTDWNAVYSELCVHAIESLPVDVLCLTDKENQSKYIQKTAENVMNWFSVMQAQQELCALLQDSEVPFVILKGAASGVYYPQPTYRIMGDIDILIKPENTAEVSEIMKRNGYISDNHADSRHMGFSKDGIYIEVHHSFADFSSRERSDFLDSLLYAAIDRAHMVDAEGFCFPMLPETENGIVLLTHIGHHLEKGLGLRQIIDWMLFVDRVLDDALWNKEFKALTQRLGLETLAVTVTGMCQLYLGLRTDITWCSQRDESLCQKLMALICEGGNFGRKTDPSKRKTFSILNLFRRNSNAAKFFRMLQERGCYNWKAVKKHTWLKPFAWFYQICRYVRLTVKHKQFLQIFKSIGKSREQNELLERLGVEQCRKDAAHDKMSL